MKLRLGMTAFDSPLSCEVVCISNASESLHLHIGYQSAIELDWLQGLWKGMLPSLIMVINPTVNYMLYENFTTQLMRVRRRQALQAGKLTLITICSNSDLYQSILW